MCFRTKDGARILLSRHYAYLSGHCYVNISINKKVERTLFVDVSNKKGETSFELINKTTGQVDTVKDISSGTYSFPIFKGNAYHIKIVSKAASGHYKVSIKKQISA